MNHALDTLKQNFTGDVIVPGNSDYEAASKVLFKQGEPLVVFRPASTQAVKDAVAYARENKLVLSVRSGGHGGAGFGTNDGGVVIDLMHLNGIEIIDKANHIVRLGAGAHWGDVAAELQKHGLAISSGDTKSVGIGGLTLGGGVGWMVREYGLCIDSLVAVEIVTADGQVLRASETEHPDLFWAVRGGSGNFGVVTQFEFAAHPIGKVYAGSIAFGVDKLTELIKGWRDVMRRAPEKLNTMFLVMPSFGGNPPSAVILCCYNSNNEQEAMAAIKPLQELGEVLHQDVTQKDYADVLEEAHAPQGIKVLVHNAFARELTDELIDEIVKAKDHIFQIRSVGGAMNRVKADATAFAHRDSEVLVISPAFVPAAASDADAAKAIAYWQEIAPLCKGAYVNFLSEQTGKEVAEVYPAATLKRLAEVKQTYDPHNLFNQNYNIKPAT